MANAADDLKLLQRETGLSVDTLRRCPKEKELSSLVTLRIGSDFKLLAAELGIEQVQVAHIVGSNPHNVPDQIFDILIKWRNKFGSEATIAVLVKAMKAVNMSIQNLNSIFT